MTPRPILIALAAATAMSGAVLGGPAAPAAPRAATHTSAEPTTNPYVGMVSDPKKVDWLYWRQKLAARGQGREVARAAGRKDAAIRDPRALAVRRADPILVEENEPERTLGGNDRTASAEAVPRFGTSGGRVPSAHVVGNLAAGPTAIKVPKGDEDNGSIPKANDIILPSAQTRRVTTGRIGDGPHGNAGDKKGDYDFYRIRHVKAGQRLLIDVDTPDSDDAAQSKLDSVLTLWDAKGKQIAVNDDDGETLDSRIALNVPADGDYYASVGAYDSPAPRDPFDAASGRGAGSEGDYSLTFGLDADDVDNYSIDLRPGDVLGASVTGAAHELSVHDPGGHLRVQSRVDQSGVYPPTSPLPGGGNAVLAHVADQGGKHTIAVSAGSGHYDLTLQVYRPAAEARGGSTVQTIFLDFDGAQVNTKIWGGAGVRNLSPFRSFLGRWGLRADQESAAIDAVVATVRENLTGDYGRRAEVRILNSRDNADPWGQPNVSRAIIGGTQDESGLATVGISQSVDPGNFDTQESALIMMDDMSAPGGVRNTTNPSLIAYFGPKSDKVRFVGTAVGNAVSHEIGHYLGSWHTSALDATADLMDQGGNFAQLWGVGKDGLGGTADDVNVHYGRDVFDPVEGFGGTQNSGANTQWGLTTTRQ
ncbi:PPC domain-containing protein [Cryptosporangium sp. NPDC051539]|uniref:PPC domain-containing protein n=1 Tax=Cryptosporangium sp. NPDC051539 TaxID=3363962 RepID=UPI0037B9DA76